MSKFTFRRIRRIGICRSGCRRNGASQTGRINRRRRQTREIVTTRFCPSFCTATRLCRTGNRNGNLAACNLRGYRTGGTIHIVINNQIGFTTTPEASRSSIYSTDAAQITQLPIFHINGDDPEAAYRVVKIALEYRQEFNKTSRSTLLVSAVSDTTKATSRAIRSR
jgi:hypothetical protein